jgi:DNA processing protein
MRFCVYLEGIFLLDDQKYWLGFSLVPNIGPKRIVLLRKHFGDLGAAWTASEGQLRQVDLGQKTLSTLLTQRKKIDLDAEMAKIRKANVWLLTLADDRYPALLRELEDAPPVLYVRGTLIPTDKLSLAIVGTRKVTNYGRDVTKRLARELAQQDITIVSGMAHGVDSVAHWAAIEGDGRTIAVLGCGIDIIYPHDNDKLARAIINNGAIISEFPLGTKPVGKNFPRRNRVVSGLSLGVLVTEAPEKSGALITATLAGEQGREVFAVPANIFNKMGGGTNRLIQDGAKLVMNVKDILSELNVAYDKVEIRRQTERISPSNEKERLVLQHLGVDPIYVDDLMHLCGLPISEVSATLTILELKGLAQTSGGMQYSLVLD